MKISTPPAEQAIDLVANALAVYRLTKLVTEDVVTQPVRNAIFDKMPPLDENGRPTASYVLTCSWCAGLWISAGALVAGTVAPRAWRSVSRGLATAAVAGIFSERV